MLRCCYILVHGAQRVEWGAAKGQIGGNVSSLTNRGFGTSRVLGQSNTNADALITL